MILDKCLALNAGDGKPILRDANKHHIYADTSLLVSIFVWDGGLAAKKVAML